MPQDVERLAATERLVQRFRWGGTAFALAQAVASGRVTVLNGAIPVLLALTCVGMARALRAAPDGARLRRLAVLSVTVDAVAAVGVMVTNAGNADSAIFLLGVFVALEAALRWEYRGGLWGGLGAAAAIDLCTLYRAAHLGVGGGGAVYVVRFAMVTLIGVSAGVAIRRTRQQRLALQRALDLSRDLIGTVGFDGRILSVNAAGCAMLGYDAADVIGRRYEGALPFDGPIRTEGRFPCKDGRRIWLEIDVTPVPEERLFHVVARDITGRRESQARLSALVQNSSDFITVLDADGAPTYVSPAVTRILGYTPEELIGTQSLDTIHPEDVDTLATLGGHVLGAPGGSAVVEYRVRHKDGRWRHVEAVMTNLFDDPAVGGVVVNSRDVTEHRRVQRELAHQAFHDGLTGLPNRALFLDRLAQALLRLRRENTNVAVLFLDLDRFKVVNDSLGHHLGDELLVAAAARLRACLRPSDTISRFGGDEFTVLMEHAGTREEAIAVAERLLASLEDPFSLNGQDVFVSTSVGIAVADTAEVDAEDLMRRADSAMYAAKAHGRGCVEVYDAAMSERAVARLALESQLRRAVERDEFVLHYQPEVSLVDGRLVGVEALVRWNHPDLGLLSPADFLPVAADAGLLVPLGRRVLEAACRQLRAWWDVHGSDRPLGVAVNLSAPELSRADLVDEVALLLARHRLPAAALTLEITESVLMEDPEAVMGTLTRLKQLGVRLAVDDFGTGYSSLSYLKRFPVDMVKIDRAFVADLGGDTDDDAIVNAVMGIARTMGLVCVAEGVEHAAQLARLADLGCHVAQGFHLARPMPADGIDEVLDQFWAIPSVV